MKRDMDEFGVTIHKDGMLFVHLTMLYCTVVTGLLFNNTFL